MSFKPYESKYKEGDVVELTGREGTFHCVTGTKGTIICNAGKYLCVDVKGSEEFWYYTDVVLVTPESRAGNLASLKTSDE